MALLHTQESLALLSEANQVAQTVKVLIGTSCAHSTGGIAP